MGNLARLNPDFNQSSTTFNANTSGVHDSDVVQLMSSDFVKRRMNARSTSRAGRRSKSLGRRSASSARRGGSGASTPFGLNNAYGSGMGDDQPLEVDSSLSSLTIYDVSNLLTREQNVDVDTIL